MDHKLLAIQEKYRLLQESIIEATGEDFSRISKDIAEIEDLALCVTDIDLTEKKLIEAKKLLDDDDFKELAIEEIKTLEDKLQELDKKKLALLIPKDALDDRNIIMEIRAGTGGEEAALFANDLLRMYMKYAETKRWKTELLGISYMDTGGVRECQLAITGKGVFARLKFESGAHRVQRVPLTEANGRIHTSTATVAVLPEAEEVDVMISEKDLRIDVFRSSGPGGQSVNTTDSAVRITHIPTGIVVQQQDEKSQHKNKAKALKILRSRLFEQEREKKEMERSNERRQQIKTGDRSEKIRTYNYPQGRVTDHRVGVTLHKLDRIMNGEDIDEFVDALVADYNARIVASID